MNRRLAYSGVQFALLFAFWVVLSGRLEPRYLVTGAISALIVVAVNERLSLRASYRQAPEESAFRWTAFLFSYVPWLVGQIVTANLQVAYAVLHPKLRIDPHVLTVPTPVHDEVAQAIFGNSITLTPGTLTVDVTNGTMIVHALSRSTADSVISGALQARVARLFGTAAPRPTGEVKIGRSFPDAEPPEGERPEGKR